MALIVVLVQCAVWYLARKILRSAYHPVVVLCQLWLVIVLSTTVFAPDFYFSPMAFLIILLMQMSAMLGGASYYMFADAANARNTRTVDFDYGYFRLVVYGSLIFGAIAVYTTLRAEGFGISSILSVRGILQVARTMSIARYEAQFKIPLAARIGQMFVFFASAVAGFNFALDKKRYRKFEYFLPIVPSLLIATIMTTRAAVLFNLTFWACANMSCSLLLSGRVNLKLITRRTALTLSGGILFIAAMFISLQFVRGGITDLGRLEEVLMHLREWPFGSIAGFSIWVDRHSFAASATGGYYTFSGIFDQLGISARKSGLYTDYVNIGSESWSNIYTVYRGLISDFTVIGAVVFMAIIGLSGSFALKKCLQGKAHFAGLLIAIYGFCLWSPIASFFGYTAHLGAFVLFGLYLRFAQRRTRSAYGRVRVVA
ncbi:hypothetical protein CIC12_00340 [Burkholderia sp. SG-MS1]|uniref:O-antigen polymerase n=1 Tax=Paraburkholderia sp. SG-MS1 TaxID=2023741 RepID=UPI001447952F|nr:O-antigen polymerase [Paraburkholderia sp. SG-MS1]NKJ45219.1 hypothetical protein [Paraburkholderia sp. SG-MS1]